MRLFWLKLLWNKKANSTPVSQGHPLRDSDSRLSTYTRTRTKAKYLNKKTQCVSKQIKIITLSL